jgi:hypothetical protein
MKFQESVVVDWFPCGRPIRTESVCLRRRLSFLIGPISQKPTSGQRRFTGEHPLEAVVGHYSTVLGGLKSSCTPTSLVAIQRTIAPT